MSISIKGGGSMFEEEISLSQDIIEVSRGFKEIQERWLRECPDLYEKYDGDYNEEED